MGTTEVVYWQHDLSGEFYAVEIAHGGKLTGICGPLSWDEVTAAKREARTFSFDPDPDEVEWAVSAAFHLVTDNLPGDSQ